MLGTWRVENAVVAFSMPLGSAFVDDFVQQSARADVVGSSALALAQCLLARSLHLPTFSPLELSSPSAPHASRPPPRTQLKGEELSYQLRWVAAPAPAGDGTLMAVQDRGFNALQETRAFLGEDGTCEAAAFALQASAPHGELRLAFRDEEAAIINPLKPPPPLLEQLVVECCQWERQRAAGGEGESFITSELIRQQLLGAGDEAPMFVESIVRFDRGRAPGKLRARNRIAMYLPPSAPPMPPPPSAPRGPAVLLTAAAGAGAGAGAASQRGGGRAVALAALAGERAVAVYDYEWSMQQVTAG